MLNNIRNVAVLASIQIDHFIAHCAPENAVVVVPPAMLCNRLLNLHFHSSNGLSGMHLVLERRIPLN